MPVELLLEVSSDVDTLPTDADEALDADDVLSAKAGRANRPNASDSAVKRESGREVCMVNQSW